MKPKLSDLWSWSGEIDRGAYAFWGALLFAVKYNLDRVVLKVCFDRSWSLLEYFSPEGPGGKSFNKFSARELAVLLALALPFLWAGVVLTLRRLRSLRWPLWLTVLFVVPVVKWLFFALLIVLPAVKVEPPRLDGSAKPGLLRRLLPRGKLGSAALGVGVALALSAAATVVSTKMLEQYGWGLFVGMPFVMGFTSVIIYAGRERRGFAECVVVSIVSAMLAAVGLLVLALEGVICIAMAAPLAAVMALMGGTVGFAVQAGAWRRRSGEVFSAALLSMPLLLGAEHLEHPEAPLLSVKTAIEVNAPPERVWRHVVAFSELPPPKEFLFRAGIAYPVRAEIQGTGAGAVRHCVFSTGPFVEPIEVWDAPRLLKFSVTKNPEPMQEWTPYRDVHPPHLDGYLASSGGQFLLMPLPGGRTRLEGTTWYRHHMWPVTYWQAWSDAIIHRIHLRVLRHVRSLAEAG
jgi:uncharacterized membrane protein YhaH (DUF805 family)